MKITESQLRKMVKESLNGFEREMAFARGGNGNTFDDGGRAAMAAMGEYGDEMQNLAMNDKGVGYCNPYDEEGEYNDQKNKEHWGMQYKQVDESEEDPLGLYSADEENSVLEEVKGLCEDGIHYFYTMLNTIEGNTYAKNNPERFKELLEKVSNLCDSIEEILYYEFK